jgi:transposase InsO family protein
VPVVCLLDSGASVSVLNYKIWKRIRPNAYTKLPSKRHDLLQAADNSAMKILFDIETNVKINGLNIPATFSVVEKLGFNCIIGMDFLSQTRSVVDHARNVLTIYDGLVTASLVCGDDHKPVFPTEAITIPPNSEAIFQARTKVILPPGNYIVEQSPILRFQNLLVARTLFEASQRVFCVHVLNISDRCIKLRSNTPIAMVSAVTIPTAEKHDKNQKCTEDISVAEMRAALEAKGVKFTDVALTGTDFENLVKLLYKYIDQMAANLNELGECNLIPFRINTGDALPVIQKPFRYSPEQKALIRQEVQKLLDAGIIEESDSVYNSNIILIKKKSGINEWRTCQDFRNLNAVTKMVSYSMPSFMSILDNLSAQKSKLIYCSLDLRQGYFQLAIDPRDAHKTAFKVESMGVFMYRKVAQGLSGSPAHFQRTMDKVLRGLIPQIACCFLDDILIYGDSPSAILKNLECVLQKLKEAGLKLHPEKSHFAVKRVTFLGHVIDENGVHMHESRIEIMNKYPAPKNAKQLKSFLGVASYSRRFVKNFSQIAAPLRELIKKDVSYKWTEQCQKAFEDLKYALTHPPALKIPEFGKEFEIACDSSISGIGWSLSQRDETGKLKICAYGGRALKDSEKRYPITQLECLALVESLKENDIYLRNNFFIVWSDHFSLKFLQSMKLQPNSRLARWALKIQGYNFKILHRRGVNNVVPDALSRIDWTETDKKLSAITAKETPSNEHVCIQFNVEDAGPYVCSVETSQQNLQLPSQDDIRDALKTCPDWSPMYNYLQSGTLPEDEAAARRLVYESDQFVLEKDLLYFLRSPRTRNLQRAYAIVKCLCIPEKYKPHIAISLHDNLCHPGFQRLLATARMRYHFKNMYAFLKQHVDTCLVCQQSKREIHPNKIPVLPMQPKQIFEKWTADIHGPYTPSTPEGTDPKFAKRYVLCLVESVSLFCELIAVSDITATTVIRAIYDNLICRYGVAASIELQTDNGSSFTADLTKKFCQTFGIRQVFSVPYHAAPNSKVEKIGESINKAIRLLAIKHDDWSNHLQTVALAHRAVASSSTGISPFECLYARRMVVNCDQNLLLKEDDSPSMEIYRRELIPKLQILQQLAQENSEQNAQINRDARNKTAVIPQFEIGDSVLLHNPVTPKGAVAKWTRRYTGPWLITHKLPNLNFRLQHLQSGRQLKRPIHIDRLRTLKQLPNDYRLAMRNESTPRLQVITPRRCIQLLITTNDMLRTARDAVVHVVGDQAYTDRLLRAAGSVAEAQFTENCEQLSADGKPFAITAGELSPTRCIVNIAVQDSIESTRTDFFACLHIADTHSEKLESISIPFFHEETQTTALWEIAHLTALAIQDLDQAADLHNRHLQMIELHCRTVLGADIAAAVCRQIFKQETILQTTSAEEIFQQTHDTLTDSTQQQHDMNNEGTQQAQTQTNGTDMPQQTVASDWYSIDRILQRQRRKNTDFFLVQWSDGSPNSWIKRADISQAALQQYLREHKRRRRRRY